MKRIYRSIVGLVLISFFLLSTTMPAFAEQEVNEEHDEQDLDLQDSLIEDEDENNDENLVDDEEEIIPDEIDFEEDERASEDEVGEVTQPITKEDKPYLALGGNLTDVQRNTVLELLGINPLELDDYDVIYITNEEEYQYLGSYISAQQIGSKSLSSVLVVKRDKGHGINITTKNISYCTIGMYKNALITAGITDADIIVAGPFSLSGTAALVGALKAYSVMTGEEISEESMDAALNELVLTGDIADSIGDSKKVEEVMAYIKQKIIEHDLTTEDEIRSAIEEAGEEFDITFSEDEIKQLTQLMLKISDLDLDLESIKNQAKALYDRLSEITGSKGFFGRIGDFFSNIFRTIGNFFKRK